ncbi:hypothetical protein [Pedobacter gandavensis]|uniref:hypothetical protein n=1 Tax=Pedobacter gandavensis TaxID=2679963 RepID=UPI0029317F16|nr:hypothetical protein [Pedobacter gandavensis]
MSIRKRIFATVILVWSLCLMQHVSAAEFRNELPAFFGSTYVQAELLEELPSEMAYTSAVKKMKYFQPRLGNLHSIVSPILPQNATKIAVAPWNWPAHGEYSFLFRLTPF